MSGIKQLRKVQGTNDSMNSLQAKLDEFLKPFVDCAIIDGLLLENISLNMGANEISHRLNRPLRGWIVTRKSADASIWDLQASNQLISKTLLLNASAAVTVSLWVF